MIKNKKLSKIQQFISAGGEGISLAQRLLCAVAFGENLSTPVYYSRKAQKVFYNLRRYRFVRRVKESDYVLTPKGERKLQLILINEVVVKPPKMWDGKWWLIFYDLPLRFKNARNAFRWKLKDLGFFQFQKSAWVYPYPCEKELLFTAEFFGVRKHIAILEVSNILDDRKLKEHFNLS